MNKKLKLKLNMNQWRNTKDLIDWFKGINEKQLCKFVIFEINDFYLSMKELLERAGQNHKLSYNISDKYNSNNNKDNCNSIKTKNGNNYNNNKFKFNNNYDWDNNDSNNNKGNF